MTTNRCKCGKRISKYARECKACVDARYAESEAIVAKGECPDCGRPLRRNSALTGWWQCSQFGSERFRADPTKPPCSFQIFTRG